MKYIVKSGSQLSTLTVASAIPQLPEGFEVIGPASEINPNNLDLNQSELQEVEVEAEQTILVREAQEAQDEVLAQDAILDAEGVEIAPAVEYQPAVEASDAIYNTIPAVRGMRVVESLSKARLIKMESIRLFRNARLLENDKAFMIALKTDQTLLIDSLKQEAETLRNIPQAAEIAMAEMNLEQINSYNPFEA
jgi:hypothetical protein